jgi:hypothetical protein
MGCHPAAGAVAAEESAASVEESAVEESAAPAAEPEVESK